MARLHAMLAEHLPADSEPDQVVVGSIETDRGPWVAALVADGYQVYAINPLSVARYRERHSTSGAKSDAADARTLADLVRTDRHRHRPVAGDSGPAEAVKVVARAHQTLIWDRQRQVQRLAATLREFFPAALTPFDDLTAPEGLELLARSPDPYRAARLSQTRILAALHRARRRHVEQRAATIQAALRSEQLHQPASMTTAYTATVTAAVAVIATLNTQITQLEHQVSGCFQQHPDAEVYLSQPGLGIVLAARVLAEFGDDPERYGDARSRKNYGGNSPVTRQSGKKAAVLARYACNDRLANALHRQAFCALRASPGARAYYDELRSRGKTHNSALRQLANRLTGILHGCLKTGTHYDEDKPWVTADPQPLDTKRDGMSLIMT